MNRIADKLRQDTILSPEEMANYIWENVEQYNQDKAISLLQNNIKNGDPDDLKALIDAPDNYDSMDNNVQDFLAGFYAYDNDNLIHFVTDGLFIALRKIYPDFEKKFKSILSYGNESSLGNTEYLYKVQTAYFNKCIPIAKKIAAEILQQKAK